MLRRAVELGIEFIDTADSYGPYVVEEMIGEVLGADERVTIATKAGMVRVRPDLGDGPAAWPPVGRPEYLRQECEMSLRRLRRDVIDLWQLHQIDPKVPRDDQFGVLRDLQVEGKVRHVGLSRVTVKEIEAAERIVQIDSVQNRYNPGQRDSEDVLRYCEDHDIAFIPWAPLGQGHDTPEAVQQVATERHVPVQVVGLAWLLQRSARMLPIPGTSQVSHLETNMQASDFALTQDEFDTIAGALR